MEVYADSWKHIFLTNKVIDNAKFIDNRDVAIEMNGYISIMNYNWTKEGTRGGTTEKSRT